MARPSKSSHQEGVRPRVKRLVLSVFIFSVFTNLLLLTGPLFMLQIYDRVLGSRSEETLVALFGLVAVLYTFYWLLEFARGRVAARAGARIQQAFDERAFRAVIENTALGNKKNDSSPLAAIGAIRTFFSSPVFLALFDLPWTPIFAACIFIFHPLLGIIAALGGGVLISTTIVNQLMTARKVSEANRLSSAADRFANEVERGSELIWAQGMGSSITKRWSRLRAQGVAQSVHASDWTGSFSSFTKGFRLFLQSALLAVGAWLVLQNEITSGAMIAASILMGRALAPIELSIASWPIVQNARTGWRSLKEFLSSQQTHGARLDLPRPAAHIVVRGVTVAGARRDKPILRNISFEVLPGEALGVIGKSGSGKTTLARVIAGLVEPFTGEVRLNGATLDQYGSERLGLYIGYLPQNVQLFHGTVAENIAHMETEPVSKKVVDAAQKARVHDIILQLPDGYETKIGPEDAQLSGGQKQRLALARALYNDPVFLVLDEPNSALDSEGSDALNAVVRAMKAEEKAVLIMTHRPTAISACDKLVVIDQGVVSGYGPRDEIIKSMMRNPGELHRVINRQPSGG